MQSIALAGFVINNDKLYFAHLQLESCIGQANNFETQTNTGVKGDKKI
jgi:hypothetical protein